MKSKILLPSILFTSLLAVSVNAIAQDASIESTADAAAQASVPTDQLVHRYADLAGSTEAATGLVQQLRGDSATGATMGYGEIDLTLALAGALVDSGEAADVDTAVDAVMQLRADGAGWGEIAQELGFNLGELASAGHRADAAARAAAGLAIAEEVRAGNAGAKAKVGVNASVDASAGAIAGATTATAADATTRAKVRRAAAADAKVNARIGHGLRGSTSGRPLGLGAPVRPERLQLPLRPQRPGGR